MAKVTKWSGVSISMQSVLGAAVDITNITKADPGVVSAASHGYANGDYVLLDVQGMNQVDERVMRVAGQTSGTFDLDGIDTSQFNTFSSGNSKKVTFGVTIATVTQVSASGGDFDFEDTTTIHETIKTQVPGSPSALTYSFENIWDVSDPGLAAMKLASDTQTPRAFIFSFPNGQKMTFNGYVGASLVPIGSAQGKVTTPTTITAFGSPTYFST